MPEATSNLEFFHRITEEGHPERPTSDDRAVWAQVAEAVLLAIVAVVTSWSGYQAAKCGAQLDRGSSLAARTTVMSQQKATLAGQDRLYDVETFNGSVAARTAQNRGWLSFMSTGPDWSMSPLFQPGRNWTHSTISLLRPAPYAVKRLIHECAGN